MTSTASNNQDDVVEMVSCGDCGHMVPEMNMAIHRARACHGRARPSTTTTTAAAAASSEDDTNNASSPQSVVDLCSSPVQTNRAATNNNNNDNNNTRKRGDNATTARKRRPGQLKRGDDCDDNDSDEEYLPMMNSNNNSDNDDDDPMDVDPSLVEHIQNHIQQQQNTSRAAAAAAASSSQVVDLLGDDEDEHQHPQQAVEEDEWACPRCTLLNAPHVRRCEACDHLKPGNKNNSSASSDNDNTFSDDDDEDIQVERVRPADPVRRERLIGGENDHDGNGEDFYSSPFGIVGGGALLGGFVGAANAYMRGRPMGSGSLEGAMGGAIAGGLANEFLRASPDRNQRQHRANNRRSRQQQQQQQDRANNDSPLSHARSAGANGLPAYPVMNAAGRRNSTREPRPSFRVVQRSNNGYTTTVVQSSGRDGSTRFVQRGGQAERDPMLSFMLHSMLSEGGPMPPGFLPMHSHWHGRGHHHGDIDGMSYDQLLAAFGDGTENLRASEEIISSLPTHKVTLKPGGSTDNNEVDLPKDAQQCSICLEDFEVGQTRKTLPCLHGMHEDCIDKWLRTNAACPVCKHSVKPQQYEDDHHTHTGGGGAM